ncbi:MAG: N-acetylmuramoyl-L-alanine amidase [Clostridia bacterium]|nr:N-acetylmuramoyl-L-alanine amidase [Clostridia bacterium]
MKKKRIVLIILFAVLSLFVIAGGLYVAGALPESISSKLDAIFRPSVDINVPDVPVVNPADEQQPPELDAYFAEKALPRDLLGVYVDLNLDVKTASTGTYGDLYNEAALYYADFGNYDVNTVFLRPDLEDRYAGFTDSYGNNVDVLREYIRHADQKGIKKVLVLDASLIYGKNGTLSLDRAQYYLSNYGFDAVMLCPETKTTAQDIITLAASFNPNVRSLFPNRLDVGIRIPANAAVSFTDAEIMTLLSGTSPDFVMVEATSTRNTLNSFSKVIGRWNAAGASFPAIRFYCEHRNDLLLNGSAEWNYSSEIVDELTALWNMERFQGSAFRSAQTLIRNQSSTSLYLSRFIFDGELKDLQVSRISVNSSTGVVSISGSSAAGRKLILNGNSLSNGSSFSFTKTLNPGLNPFEFKSCGKTLEYDIYHNDESSGNRIGYADAVSPYVDNGLGVKQVVLIKNDDTETLGTISEKDTYHADSSTLPAGTLDYLERMELSGEGYLRYVLSSGNTVYGVNCELIDNGYVMPSNKVVIDHVDDTSPTSTDIVINSDWFVPVNVKCNPQSYYRGYDSYSYNISAFTADHVDIILHHTAEFYNLEALQFAAASPFLKAELYQQGDSLILRLYLKKAGQFYGFDIYKNELNQIVISFKKHADGGLAGKTIMIDAGHGGWYMTGTSLADNTCAEKTVTLAIALKTKAMLESRGATVIMTRVYDTSLTLEARTAMIGQYNPDLFVSIHCDGNTNPNDAGTHTFYFRPYSMPLADCINQSLSNVYKTYIYHPGDTNFAKVDKSIKYYPFFVTRMNQCPSVLIETGFMTNPTEGAILTNDNSQMWLAQGIADGITNYFATNY